MGIDGGSSVRVRVGWRKRRFGIDEERGCRSKIAGKRAADAGNQRAGLGTARHGPGTFSSHARILIGC